MPDRTRLTRLAAAAVDRLEGLQDLPAEDLNDPNVGPYVEIVPRDVLELAKLEDVPRDVLELCELAHPADADDEKLVAALRLGSANASGPVAYVLAAQVVRLAALAGIDPPPHTPASASGNTAAKAAKATSKPSEAASVAANVAGDVGPGK